MRDLEAQTSGYSIGGQRHKAPALPAGLYVVSTPIGNLGDVTLRALETLAGAHLIACEDTRVTRRLLDRYAISTRLTPYHDHNAAELRPRLIAAIKNGDAVALVSDAGTPLISDPGYKLVRQCHTEGCAVTAIPGPSGVLAALCVAGLPSDRFFFEGFLPTKTSARRQRAAELAQIPATLVVYEAGPRIAAALVDLAEELGPREAAICRELTKLHEEVRRGDLASLATTAPQAETRGEFVIVIAPPEKTVELSPHDLDALLRQALDRSSLREAVSEVAQGTRQPRKEIYRRALALRRDDAQ